VILVDTSAWVEWDRATGSDAHLRVRDLIATTDDVAVTEPVVMEITAGAKDEARERELRRFLARFVLLPFDPGQHFSSATRIYRECRRRGVTPRGLIDCMIAAVAMSEGAALLAHDADLSRIAGVMDLDLDPSSLQAP
jgi:predicted nucleic acid-binding protein